MRRLTPLFGVLGLWLGFAPLTAAPARADMPTYTLSIKDNRFEPATIEIPAGVKVKLIVKNLDSGPEEFESRELKREKLIAAGGQATVLIGPLKPGEYGFFGEFHPETAQGKIIVKAGADQ